MCGDNVTWQGFRVHLALETQWATEFAFMYTWLLRRTNGALGEDLKYSLAKHSSFVLKLQTDLLCIF